MEHVGARRIRKDAPDSAATQDSAGSFAWLTGTDRLILKIVAQSVAHLDDIIAALARYGTPTVSIVLASKSRPVRAGVRGN